ncbi:MAG: hypothetical protein ACU0GE_17770 [Pseudooceanicola nanhaiensis]|uniref:hypothetical protein n=1 Tax=Pseudooceanicola nanhaiensis TaxID=375761 RepID=UPI004058A95D
MTTLNWSSDASEHGAWGRYRTLIKLVPEKKSLNPFPDLNQNEAKKTMHCIGSSRSRATKIKEIEAALDFLADAIEEGADGDALECIYERLESELAALEARNNTRDRIRERRDRRAMLHAA